LLVVVVVAVETPAQVVAVELFIKALFRLLTRNLFQV
jgi:hypothetical protein